MQKPVSWKQTGWASAVRSAGASAAASAIVRKATRIARRFIVPPFVKLATFRCNLRASRPDIRAWGGHRRPDRIARPRAEPASYDAESAPGSRWRESGGWWTDHGRW